MAAEQTNNPLRKFKLVFLGEQSGSFRNVRSRLTFSSNDFVFSGQDLIDHSVHV